MKPYKIITFDKNKLLTNYLTAVSYGIYDLMPSNELIYLLNCKNNEFRVCFYEDGNCEIPETALDFYAPMPFYYFLLNCSVFRNNSFLTYNSDETILKYQTFRQKKIKSIGD